MYVSRGTYQIFTPNSVHISIARLLIWQKSQFAMKYFCLSTSTYIFVSKNGIDKILAASRKKCHCITSGLRVLFFLERFDF